MNIDLEALSILAELSEQVTWPVHIDGAYDPTEEGHQIADNGIELAIKILQALLSSPTSEVSVSCPHTT